MSRLRLCSVIFVPAFLTACGTDSDNAATGASSPIAVYAASGNKLDASGEWHGPCVSNYPDTKVVYKFSGSTIYVYKDKYTTTDGSCAGTVNTREKEFFYQNSNAEAGNVATVTGEKTAAGWVDTNDIGTTAPTSLAGPALSDTPKVSTVDMPSAWSVLLGDYRLIIFIDDSDAANGNYSMYMAESENKQGTYPGYLKNRVYTKLK